MANILPMETRVRIVGALTEGNSIRAASRMTGVDKNAIMELAIRIGEGCAHLHNERVRGLACYNIEGDETWSFISKKEARCDPSKDPLEWGDVYTFIAMDAGSKVVISYLAGKRDQETTDAFVKDLRARLTVVPQFTTDGWQPYITAVGQSFGGSIDYAQVVKNYSQGAHRGPDHRYEPPRDPFITKKAIRGAPDMDLASTSYVERLNLTMRHTVGRTRRLCLAFSKTLRGHRAAMALGIMAYNFTRRHETLGRTPAEAAKLADHQWTMAELVVAALEAIPVDAPKPGPLALHPSKAGSARELPGGRGWLRVVGGASSAPGGPAAAPPSVSPAPVVAVGPLEVEDAAATDPSGQLDLFAWTPRPVRALPPPGSQLDLFGPRE